MNIDSTPGRFPEERRLATVLFADVQGFTSLAEQLDFETVSDMIKGIWSRLDKAIVEQGGYIDKHLGDGIMALWGAPYAGDNDAEQAVAAGLSLQKSLDEFCKMTDIPGADALKLRVGINSGPVFAGYVGTRSEYTVIGDTVNVAARLEQIAEPGTVVIGEGTLRMVRGNFRVRRLEPTKVKGKNEQVQPYAVEGVLASPGRIRYQSADSLVTVMVGRDNELEKLKTFYNIAFDAERPIMCMLSGDVGIGKSRLLMEFGNRLEEAGENVNILSTRGLAQAIRVPFYLWRVLIRNRFGVREEDPSATVKEKITNAVEDVWDPAQHHSKVEVTEILGQMIGLHGDASFSSQETLNRVFFMTRELLRRLSIRRRLILLFDDMQWADRESLALLSYLVNTHEPPMQMLVVGAARPDFLKHQLQWHNMARIIEITPIAFNTELVKQAYPDLKDTPDSVLEEIGLRAEGNPYFLEEIVKSLVKNGLLDQKLSAQEIHNRMLAQIPESLRATLQARLDNLSREARTVALLASVVGRIFWVGAVLEAAQSAPLPGSVPMVNIPPSVVGRFVQDGLRQLVRAEMAFPRSGSQFSDEQEYIFKNTYLRDVAYSMIPNRNRAQFHRAVADWLKKHNDPAFRAMSQEHEQSSRLSTGSLPALQ
jgi:class 3 adenylate cyclase